MEKQKGELGFELALVKEKHKEIRTTVIISAAVLATLGIIGLICYLIAQNGFSVESLLSTILAIFSIVISMMFYFKTDTASSKFYDKVYEFNNTQEALLRKIDLVFNQRIDEVVRVVAEIRKEEDKVKIIEQRKESSTDTNEKDKLERELILSRKEIDILNSKLSELSNLQGNSILNNYDKNYSTNSDTRHWRNNLVHNLIKSFTNDELLEAILRERFNTDSLSNSAKNLLLRNGIMDTNGAINTIGLGILVDAYSSKRSQ